LLLQFQRVWSSFVRDSGSGLSSISNLTLSPNTRLIEC
jgi:hypothetical protein